MVWSRIWEHLAPPGERDDALRREMRRLGESGLKTLGAVEIAVPVFIFLLHFLVHPEEAVRDGYLRQAAILSVVGAATVAAARLKWSRSRPHALALASAFVWAGTLIGASLVLSQPLYESGDYIPTGITVIMLTVVAAMPLRPLQVLTLGLSIEALYTAAGIAVFAGALQAADQGTSHHVFIVTLALLSTGVTAVLYARRRGSLVSHQQALRVMEALTGAQLRAQLAENAMAIGKLAAALTHEINSPLGAMRSAIDTLLVVAARQATAPPEKHASLVELQAELRRSIQSSAERLHNVVERLQRFVALEEAEVKSANLNDLLRDVAVLFEEKIRASKIDLCFDLEPLPDLDCRPQLITAVFSSLLSNAIDAVNGEGRIVISTRRAESLVHVRIQDNGRGMSAEDVEHIFDPGFRVAGERVYSGNWSLFNIRQILFEHGGDIEIDSAEGRGTTISVTLPT